MNSIPPRQDRNSNRRNEKGRKAMQEPSKSVGGESLEALRHRGFSKHDDNIDPSSRTPRPRREANARSNHASRRHCRRRDPPLAPVPAPKHRRGGVAARAVAPSPCRRNARTVPESMGDKRYKVRPVVLPPNTNHYLARPLVLPPNTNRRKTPTLKRPARTRGIDVGLTSRKFVVPLGAPSEPVVAAFNKILVHIYNTIAGLKGLLEEVNVANPQLLQAILNQVNSEHPEHFGPENKKDLCSILRKGVHRLRSKAYTIRCLVTDRGSKPINEPLEWNRA